MYKAVIKLDGIQGLYLDWPDNTHKVAWKITSFNDFDMIYAVSFNRETLQRFVEWLLNWNARHEGRSKATAIELEEFVEMHNPFGGRYV